jgi:hypothetical protein
MPKRTLLSLSTRSFTERHARVHRIGEALGANLGPDTSSSF